MNFSQALDKTLSDCDIQAKWLAEKSGVSKQMISGFRNGRQQIQSDSLEKILASLPNDAREYFFSLLGIQMVAHYDIPAAIEHMSKKQLARLLVAIAMKLEEPPVSKEQEVKELLTA